MRKRKRKDSNVDSLPKAKEITSPRLYNSTSRLGFLDLPRELRDMVYANILTNGPPGGMGIFRLNIGQRMEKIKGRGVTRTLRLNKQIFMEAKEALYSLNIFSIDLTSWNPHL
ncbi:uncharacterized protein BDZ99DRAFT_230977 [Mytilinidion resinicola]|uniref:F-box domain-containing protein n=1 Tax=Mytilinidion resinicola TaxID=574789 RepID=A0A6A6YZW2_9PEZI|nr:uncharacterized protein BDZ99DRAFT_230977 [Mytilinidion resinicola]KAF2814068.1 hypothetical protein BDZ99DRAFT_230977 [Mytilinidion resinicola]